MAKWKISKLSKKEVINPLYKLYKNHNVTGKQKLRKTRVTLSQITMLSKDTNEENAKIVWIQLTVIGFFESYY